MSPTNIFVVGGGAGERGFAQLCFCCCLQAQYATTSAGWEASRSVEGTRRRDDNKEDRHTLFIESGGPAARAASGEAPGPEKVGQGCTGCGMRNHFSLSCSHWPKLCKPCCIAAGGVDGPCAFHRKQMEELAHVAAKRKGGGK